MKRFISSLVILTGSLISTGLVATNNTITLNGGSNPLLAKITQPLQQIIDWLGGPGVLFVGFIFLVIVIIGWVAVPKNSGPLIVWGLRVVVGLILIFNIALVLTWLQGL